MLQKKSEKRWRLLISRDCGPSKKAKKISCPVLISFDRLITTSVAARLSRQGPTERKDFGERLKLLAPSSHHRDRRFEMMMMKKLDRRTWKELRLSSSPKDNQLAIKCRESSLKVLTASNSTMERVENSPRPTALIYMWVKGQFSFECFLCSYVRVCSQTETSTVFHSFLSSRVNCSFFLLKEGIRPQWVCLNVQRSVF